MMQYIKLASAISIREKELNTIGIKKSVHWFERGAKAGSAKSMIILSQFYMVGIGTIQSDDIDGLCGPPFPLD